MSKQNPKIKRIYFCLICGSGTTSCFHFGALSCKACAAFFRRTVMNNRIYFCSFDGTCVMDLERIKKCQSCRLEKCISLGMKASKVHALGVAQQKKTSLEAKANSNLQLVLSSTNTRITQPNLLNYNYLSHQNNVLLQRILIANNGIEHKRMTFLPPAKHPLYKTGYMPNISKCLLNESQFCHLYLKNTGIMDLVKDAIDDQPKEVVIQWSYLTMILSTLKFDSVPHRKITMIDHSMIEMSEATVKQWYATEPYLVKNLNILLSTTLPLWYRIEELVREIRVIGMTNEEKAYFQMLCMIETIIRLSSEPKLTRLRFKPFLNTLFVSMKYYYRDNFSNDCSAIRMGNIIMALSVMNEIIRLLDEHRTITMLCYSSLENYDTNALLKVFQNKQCLN